MGVGLRFAWDRRYGVWKYGASADTPLKDGHEMGRVSIAQCGHCICLVVENRKCEMCLLTAVPAFAASLSVLADTVRDDGQETVIAGAGNKDVCSRVILYDATSIYLRCARDSETRTRRGEQMVT